MKELCRTSGTIVLFALTSLFLVGTGYAETAFDSLLKAKSLRCTFTIGSAANSKTGILKPSIVKEDMTIVFDSIDLRKGTARGVGEAGASNEIAAMTPTGMTFIEQTGSGNYVFTTVFAEEQDPSERFLAAMSRHMQMIGTIIVSQYYGACQVLPSQ
jgi:hypothetical protein